VTAIQTITLPGEFVMRRGRITQPTLAFETWGELNAAKDNAVLIFTGLSPSAHAASSIDDPSAGWWEDMVGPAKPIDTDTYFVICVNSLGSCFGSTGPASINPKTQKVYRLTFPVLTVEDIADAAAHVLDHLKVDVLHTVVGASMGGMTALAFTQEQPGRARRLVSISSAARSLPFSIALRSLQREMIHSDPTWNNGNYDLNGNGPVTGMRLARKLGMITYRSAAEWAERFGRERATDFTHADNPFGIDFEVESYLESHANRFIGSFDANCYLYLSRAMDLFDAADHGGSLAASFAKLKIDSALIIGVETDFLFPVEQQEELALALDAHLDEVIFKRLPSIQGHDSFLVDMDRFRPAVAEYF
jgi:homoserine O-acetyltransferase/O-succinyltransferase